MSYEYSHIGTVRRRPRTAHQRSSSDRAREPLTDTDSQSGAHNGNGSQEFSGARSSGAKKKSRAGREESRRSFPSFGPDLEIEPGFRLPFDPWRLIRAAKRNAPWIILGGALLAVLGFFLAASTVDYKISMGLMRKTSNAMRNEGVQMVDKFMVREYSDQTIYSFMK